MRLRSLVPTFLGEGWMPKFRQVRKPTAPDPTRRAFAVAALGGLALPGQVAAGALPAAKSLEDLTRPELAGLVRGLSGLERTGDDSLVQTGETLLTEITAIMPETPQLAALHRHYWTGSKHAHFQRPVTIDAEAIHMACHEARPVSFDYTDLRGNVTSRRVLPLELVHPGHGVLLLAYCELRQAQRKFFLHAMKNLRVEHGDFSSRRVALLQGAVDEIRPRRDYDEWGD